MRERCFAVLDAAWASGIRYFDAARSYGRAEEFLSAWLAARGIAPADVVVGSKWGYRYTADWQVAPLLLANGRLSSYSSRAVPLHTRPAYRRHRLRLYRPEAPAQGFGKPYCCAPGLAGPFLLLPSIHRLGAGLTAPRAPRAAAAGGHRGRAARGERGRPPARNACLVPRSAGVRAGSASEPDPPGPAGQGPHAPEPARPGRRVPRPPRRPPPALPGAHTRPPAHTRARAHARPGAGSGGA